MLWFQQRLCTTRMNTLYKFNFSMICIWYACLKDNSMLESSRDFHQRDVQNTRLIRDHHQLGFSAKKCKQAITWVV